MTEPGDDASTRLNLLLAYPYAKREVMDVITGAAEHIRLLIDSGAFTAWKAGTTIQLDDYCKFIEALPVPPWRYFTLDVVGDPDGTMRNYETMLARGFKPVPIFTRGEDPAALEHLYATSDVVGLGGLVGTQGNRGFVNGIMEKVAGRRVHWLGFTSGDFLRAYRPYMADSSSWESGARFASVRLYAGRGRFMTISKKVFQTRPPQEVLDAVRAMGASPEALRFDKAWHGGWSTSRALGATSGVAFSLEVTRNLGTILFNAAASEHAIQHLLNGFAYLQGREFRYERRGEPRPRKRAQG